MTEKIHWFLFLNMIYTHTIYTIVLNAAAHVLTGTHKFDRGLSRLLHTELHWLDIPQRVTYKLGVITFGCQYGRAPQYLIDYCLPVSDVASRRPLVVPRHRLSTYGRRAFAVAGPTAWNSFPDNLQDPDVTTDVENVFVLSVSVQLAH